MNIYIYLIRKIWVMDTDIVRNKKSQKPFNRFNLK